MNEKNIVVFGYFLNVSCYIENTNCFCSSVGQSRNLLSFRSCVRAAPEVQTICNMKRNKTIMNEALVALRKLQREEEIAMFGKQIAFRQVVFENKKKYNRKKLKKISILG